ncbi:MAG TPA: hypothetical protein DC005_02055, partial [Proteobacteria bacterium]|nr:hypothetical protein [Pseudomonadota bacterium]
MAAARAEMAAPRSVRGRLAAGDAPAIAVWVGRRGWLLRAMERRGGCSLAAGRAPGVWPGLCEELASRTGCG